MGRDQLLANEQAEAETLLRWPLALFYLIEAREEVPER
jgi:hypothetical protein